MYMSQTFPEHLQTAAGLRAYPEVGGLWGFFQNKWRTSTIFTTDGI